MSVIVEINVYLYNCLYESLYDLISSQALNQHFVIIALRDFSAASVTHLYLSTFNFSFSFLGSVNLYRI